jgi:1,5-anhydro-D-fructose reductase (1,5-anhydro-D-mannitol-forming)
MTTSSANTKIRIGLVGFGAFAERAVLPALREVDDVDVVAVQKRSLAEAEAKARMHGIPQAYASVEELVTRADVDAVFIVSANGAHCPETLLAARAGKHVLVEKPMALNVAEAEQMIEACQSAGVRLMVGHLVRFSPLIRHIRARVQSGILGTITYARADFSYDGRISKRGWLHEKGVAGGGPMFDIGVHCLDTLRYILNDEVQSVSSTLAQPPGHELTEESALVGLQFSRGTLGAIFCSYASPSRRKQLEILGTEGVITVGDFTSGSQEAVVTTVLGTDARPGETMTETITVPNLIAAEVRNFCGAILHGDPLESPGENGLANQRVLAAVYANVSRGARP